MNSLERPLQWTVALTAAIAATLFGVGQQSLALPVVLIVAAGLSLWLTDSRKTLRLNRPLANLAALGAVALTIQHYFQTDSAQQLLAIARMLVYLQVILFFQEKSPRVYWQLLSLSLLEVVVAAALTDSVLFGALMVLFLVSALTALILLFLAREARRFQSVDLNAGAIRARRPARSFLAQPIYGTNQPRPADLRRGLRRYVLATTAVTLLAMLAAFFLTPRFIEGNARRSRFSASAVGFSTEIRLDEPHDRFVEDTTIVVRLRLSRPDEPDRPLELNGPVYLRGAVQQAYERGRWRPTDRTRRRQPLRFATPQPPARRHLVTQSVTIEPLRGAAANRSMFCVYPFVAVEPTRRYRYRRNGASLGRDADQSASREPYILGTLGIINGRQHTVTPASEPEALGLIDSLDPAEQAQLTATIELARRIAADAPDSAAQDTFHLARRLENHLRNSGEFTYRLGALGTIGASAEEDPTDVFVSRTHSGHCEYYASALALMLRSQGIPSRVVTGFQSGEWNGVGGYYQIRNAHAHAWVEAYLAAEQIPDALRVEGVDYRHGAWLRLDGTPPDEGPDLGMSGSGLWLRMKNLFDHVDLLWRNYIVGFNQNMQSRWLAEPLANSVSPLWSWFEGLTNRLRLTGPGAATGARFWFTIVLIVVGVGGLLFAIAWSRPHVARLWRRTIGREKRGAGAGPLSFYRDFEAIFARRGVEREQGQTQHEFAMAIGGRLADSAAHRQFAGLPRTIVAAYYRVRFGGEPLDASQTETLQRDVARLEAALGRRDSKLLTDEKRS